MSELRIVCSTLFLGYCCMLVTSFADGPTDNHPDTVRRIPKLGIEVPQEREAQLRTKLAVLNEKLNSLSSSKDELVSRSIPDVMIFERAVRCALDYQEFFAEVELSHADKLLDEGLRRCEELQMGRGASWLSSGSLTVAGYISRIDGTVQPYGLVIPRGVNAKDISAAHQNNVRCDLWFHGRGETLSEVNFLWDRLHKPGEYTPRDAMVVHPYGRYSNAFKFAGEVDVLEAIENAKHRFPIDPNRISVRGFSMGGAACWQFATHYSDRWFAANPGAGFSETRRFLEVFQQESLSPTPWQKALWNLYDCDRYALNLTHCPTIAYSGEIDKQKQAADVMAEALDEHGIRLRHIVGVGMGHKMDAASKQIIEDAMTSLAERGRQTLPQRVHLETYTLKYNRMHWLTIDALDEHWKRAYVEAELAIDVAARSIKITLATDNVNALSLDFPAGTFRDSIALPSVWVGDKAKMIELPGPKSDGSWKASLERIDGGTWATTATTAAGLRKRHKLQGPIDDALMDSFVFVRPTGQSSSQAAGRWSEAELTRAIEHWRRHFRGDARVIDDVDVTQAIADSANLILWGDPSSNQVMAKLVNELPITWDPNEIRVGDQSFSAANHALIAIYPNPMNPDRYVVLNSSFTFRDYAYLNNARQVPMLPDWAIVNLDAPPGAVDPGEVVVADFFDEFWQLKP